MKLTTLIILIACLHVSAAAFSQRITLSEKEASLESVFAKLEQQSGYTFFYKVNNTLQNAKVNLDVKNGTLKQVLEQLLKDLPLTYSVVDKTVVISRKVTIPQPSWYALPNPKVIIGKVTDERGNPLPGVTIKIKGTNAGGVTSARGEFSIYVNDNNYHIIVFTFIGYITQEIDTRNVTNPLNVFLKEDVSSLDEVQVLAYGQTTRRLSTGDVTTITSKEIATNPVPNVLQALQGRVPGLFIQQYSGLPNSTFNVQIRGNSSISGTKPLYVVDGATYPAGETLQLLSDNDLTFQNNLSRGGNALNFLNPNEIESISVLKDADATAIYGARGANGVILITTKKGKAGIPRMDGNVRTGVSTRTTSPKLMNTQQYLDIRREAFKNDGATPGATDRDLNGTWDTTRYTDWQKYATGIHAPRTDANLSYSGGSGNTNYRISGSYSDQRNVQIGGGGVTNVGMRMDINSTSANKKFYFDVTAGFNGTGDDTKPGDYSNMTLSLKAPNSPDLFLPNGDLNWETGSNELQDTKLLYKSTTSNLLGNAVLRYSPIAGLDINATVGYNQINGRDYRAQPTAYYPPSGNVLINAISQRGEYTLRTWTIDPNVSYIHKLGLKGTLEARVGGTLVDKYNPASMINGVGFISDALLADPAIATTVTASYSQSPARNLGYFGIVKYNWANKYLLSLNGRRDGSTRFGPDRQFGNFGSIGAAWIFTEENWLKDHFPALSFGKLRGSYGLTGNDVIPDYAFLPTFTVTPLYDGKSGLFPNGISNPTLHWESKKEQEVELDLEFFKGRISATGTYYANLTYDQLSAALLSSVTGFTQFYNNNPAKIRTNGWEFTLNTHNIQSRNFSWSTNINVSIPHSKLVAYPGLNAIGGTTSNVNYIVGKPTTGVKMFNYAGIDPETGLYNFINAAGKKDAFQPLLSPTQLDNVADRTQYLDLAPKYFGGISNSFRYKNFNLDVFFNFTNRVGKTLLGSQTFLAGFFNQNGSTVWLNRWQKPGDVTNVPKVSQSIFGYFNQANFTQSTGAYENATYARLANLSLSYSLPNDLLKRYKVSGLSVFIQGQNLLTISKYGGGLDPENLTAGALPPLRTVTAGLNINL